MAHPDFASIPAELLAEVGGGTRMCTSGTSENDLTDTMMQMMQMMQSAIQQLGSNNSSSSTSMMLPMMMMMKNKQG